MLDGLTSLPDVSYAGLFIQDEKMSESGEKVLKNNIDYEWELVFENEGANSEYGFLSTLVSGLKNHS